MSEPPSTCRGEEGRYKRIMPERGQPTGRCEKHLGQGLPSQQRLTVPSSCLALSTCCLPPEMTYTEARATCAISPGQASEELPHRARSCSRVCDLPCILNVTRYSPHSTQSSSSSHRFNFTNAPLRLTMPFSEHAPSTTASPASTCPHAKGWTDVTGASFWCDPGPITHPPQCHSPSDTRLVSPAPQG